MGDVFIRPPTWYWNCRNQSLEYYPRKIFANQNEMLEDDRSPSPDIIIPRNAFYDLEDWLNGEGKNRVASARKEDLKIINSLLEIVKIGMKPK